jgi:diphosphomevalonate decarboxylase
LPPSPGGVNRILDLGLDDRAVSALARLGSGSATRSVFGGFVAYPEGAESAEILHAPDHWPDLRCIIVQVSAEKKSVSSRKAMEASRSSSPYFSAWVEDSRRLYREAVDAIDRRDLEALGPVIRRSYLRMFSTMFSADDPVIFWQEDSLRVIRLAASCGNRVFRPTKPWMPDPG